MRDPADDAVEQRQRPGPVPRLAGFAAELRRGIGPSRKSPGWRRRANRRRRRSRSSRPARSSSGERTLGSPFCASCARRIASAVRTRRGSEAGNSPNGTASDKAVMSSVAECSIRKSGFSVQMPRSLEQPAGVQESARLRVREAGALVAAGGDRPAGSPRSRSDRRRRSTARSSSSWPSFSASRAAARSPATTQAFE